MATKLYQGRSECPQCGCGSDDLIPDSLPVVVREFADTVELACQICGRLWLQKPEVA